RAVGVRGDPARDVGDSFEVRVELHQPRPELGCASAVQILVVIMTRGVLVIPAATTESEVLFLRQLFSGRQLGRRRRGLRVEAGASQSGEAGRDAYEIAAAHADDGEAFR